MRTLEEFRCCNAHRQARVCLLMQWGRVAGDASWYDKMVADPVSCLWLGNIMISDWLSCIAICTDVVTDAVFKKTCAIRRERVLAPVLVNFHAPTVTNLSPAEQPRCSTPDSFHRCPRECSFLLSGSSPMLYAVQVSTPVFQVPQELQCQKLAVLTQRANRAAGMQMIAHSRNTARKTR